MNRDARSFSRQFQRDAPANTPGLPVISTFFPWNDIGTSRLPRRILVLPFAIVNASPWVFPPLTPPTVNIRKGRIRMKFDFRLDFSSFSFFLSTIRSFLWYTIIVRWSAPPSARPTSNLNLSFLETSMSANLSFARPAAALLPPRSRTHSDEPHHASGVNSFRINTYVKNRGWGCYG